MTPGITVAIMATLFLGLTGSGIYNTKTTSHDNIVSNERIECWQNGTTEGAQVFDLKSGELVWMTRKLNLTNIAKNVLLAVSIPIAFNYLFTGYAFGTKVEFNYNRENSDGETRYNYAIIKYKKKLSI